MLEVGTKLVGGRFELVRRLGEGGMGVVFEAIDRRGGGRVALKTVQSLSGRSLYRFKREFRALEDIQHPNLVQLRELHREDELWFFTMELVEGRDFRSFVTRSQSQSPAFTTADLLTTLEAIDARSDLAPTIDETIDAGDERLRTCLAQLVGALGALHRAGRIHRDVKPSNVLVTPDERVVLLDFGLIAEFEGLKFRPADRKGFSGTLRYMAPEQAAGEDTGPPADLYAVGVMLYEVLCGGHPFHGPPVKIVLKKRMGEYQRAVDMLGARARPMADLCDALLRPDPRERPTASEVLDWLRGENSTGEAIDLSSESSGVFVGREAELEALGEAWQDVERGEAVSVVVEGEAGVGKSSLVRRFVETQPTDAEDMLLLYGRCYEREAVPYKGVDRVVDDLSRFLESSEAEAEWLIDDDVVALARIFPVLSQVPAVQGRQREGRAVRNPREVRRRGFAALKALLRRLGERRRLMIVIDDLQWADADSVALLGELVEPPDAPRMLLLATQRPSQQPVELAGQVRRLSLEGLDQTEVEAMVDSLGQRGAWDAETLARETGGHPLFVQQLVQYMVQSAAEQGVGLEEVLWRRITEMPGTSRRLIELLALAGVPLEIEVLSAALGVGLGDGVELARQAQTAMLARITNDAQRVTVEPYHDRVREAATRHIVADDRSFFHARLAEALEATGRAQARPYLMLRHLEGAGEEPRAARFAVQAAEQAAEAMAFERAAELYRQALRIGEYSPSRRRELELELARALSNAGLGIEAAELYLQAVEAVPPDRRLVLERRAAEELMTNGDVERGMRLIDEVLEGIGASGQRSTVATIFRVVWQRLVLSIMGLRRRRRRRGDRAERMQRRLDIFATLGRRLALIDTLRGFDFQNRELLLALRYGDDKQLAAALATEAAYRSSSGTTRGIEAGEQVLTRARHLAAGLEDPWLDNYTAMQWGIICFFAERFEVAVDTLGEAVEWFASESPGDQYLVNFGRLFMMFALRHLGRVRRMSELYETFVRDARHRNDKLVHTTIGTSANTYWLFRGDPKGARRQLDEAEWAPPQRSVHLQHWFDFVARGEIAIYEGQAHDFLAQNDAEMARLGRNPVIWASRPTLGEHRWLEGRLHAAAVDEGAEPGRHRRALRRKVGQLGREDSRMVQLWGTMLEAAGLALDGDVPATLDALERAVEQASAVDMKVCEMTATQRLGEILVARRIDPERGEALLERVDAWMQAEAIADPDRVVQFYMPGFRRLIAGTGG